MNGSIERYDDVNETESIFENGSQIEDYKGGIVVFDGLLDHCKEAFGPFLTRDRQEIWPFKTNSKLILTLQKEIMIMN